MFDENPSREIRDKRLAIAQDVLLQLEQSRLDVAAKRCYVLVPGAASARGVDLRDFLENETVVCEVCALGACLVAKARLFDEVPLIRFDPTPHGDRDITRHETASLLGTIFSDAQLVAIECAFEGQVMHGPFPLVQWLFNNLKGIRARLACQSFGEHLSATDRLRAIMNNIIEHDGVFRPDLAVKVEVD